jgi:hypothetical protein
VVEVVVGVAGDVLEPVVAVTVFVVSGAVVGGEAGAVVVAGCVVGGVVAPRVVVAVLWPPFTSVS